MVKQSKRNKREKSRGKFKGTELKLRRSYKLESHTDRIIQNAITSVGKLFATSDYSEKNKVEFVFTKTIKKDTIKATDQFASGRIQIGALTAPLLTGGHA